MARHSHTHVYAQALRDLRRQLIGYRRISVVLHEFLQILLAHLRPLLGNRALGHRQDRKALLILVPLLDGAADALDIIRNLRDQNDIRSARDSCVKRKLPYLMSHNFNDKYTSVGRRRGMNAVDALGRDIHRALEAEGHVRSPDIIVNRLRHMEDVQTFFPQKVRRLLGSVSAQDHQAVQTQLVVGLLHGLHLVQPLLVRHPHHLERLTGASQNRAALCQDS